MNSFSTFVTYEMDMRKVWRDQFENMYDIRNNKEVNLNVCGLDYIRRNMYFGEWGN